SRASSVVSYCSIRAIRGDGKLGERLLEALDADDAPRERQLTTLATCDRGPGGRRRRGALERDRGHVRVRYAGRDAGAARRLLGRRHHAPDPDADRSAGPPGRDDRGAGPGLRLGGVSRSGWG